jgi:hypothetical protein
MAEGKGKEKMVDNDEEVDGKFILWQVLFFVRWGVTDMANTGSATHGADIRELEAAADQENDHPANQPSDVSDTLTSTNAQRWNDDNVSERGDGTDSLPPPILSTHTSDSKINKWKLWIRHYWDVNDCRDLIPEKMFQRATGGAVMRGRLLENYQGMPKGRLLELLYELAQMSGKSRKKAAWTRIEERWEMRAAGKNGNKAFTAGDVKYAIGYFQFENLRRRGEGGGESSIAARGAVAVAASHSHETHGQNKPEKEAAQDGDKEHESANEDVGAEDGWEEGEEGDKDLLERDQGHGEGDDAT